MKLGEREAKERQERREDRRKTASGWEEGREEDSCVKLDKQPPLSLFQIDNIQNTLFDRSSSTHKTSIGEG